uniref:NADH dehydrogenase subunit 6 n=1 Tax=Drepanocentron fuxiensis TaxID=3058442 RepID=UPI0026E31C08|nr:NADH dehydrogenase subunit 6 [Drepanocentron fuxiensis]WJW73317.1 NADH dehydrogenase subunit 6 [Drepanocentron fuxiensis]
MFKIMLMSLMMMINLIFFTLSHPMTINFMIMLQMIMSTIMMGLLIKTFWYSYIMFIIFVSGLLILFTYMCSINSNLTFKMKFKNFILINYVTLMITSLMIFLNINFKNLLFNLINSQYNFNLMFMNSISLFKLTNYNSLNTTLMMIFLLFFMLIISSIMLKFMKSPMRKMY